MSRANTKDSKIDRLLLRQRGDRLDILEVLRLARETRIVQKLTVERLSNSLKLATETAHRLEAENSRLRKYLGSVLFARRQREASIDPPLTHLIPTINDSLEILGPLINDLPQGRLTRPICSCKPGECRGYQQYCRHRLENLNPCGCTLGFCEQMTSGAAQFGQYCKNAKAVGL